MKRRLSSLALAGALLVLPQAATAAVPPSTSVFPQTTAEPPIAVPSTPSCSEQVVVHDFQNSYYAPGVGAHTPPAACPAPWSKVVLTYTGSVSGVQFDRLLDVYLGEVPILSSSTSEPCCMPTGATTTWTVRKDVTQFAGLLEQPQTVTVFLNNVWIAGQYTGIYHITVSLDFYRTGPGAPAAAHPDAVVPVTQLANSGGDGYFSLGASGQLGSSQVVLPRNLLQLKAEVYAQGHGPCEEFWWADPSQCGVGTPYREAAIYVDGALAGAAPVYPTLFTGADGPGLWEPIPSPRAWNLRPSVLDLTPFVGRLVDGLPHTVAVGVPNAVYKPGDYWLVGANLLAWTDHAATQTSGALTGSSAPARPTETSAQDPTGLILDYQFSAKHALHWSGWVQGSAGRTATTVWESISEHTTQLGISTFSTWHWRNTTSTPVSKTVANAAFSLANTTPASFELTDGGDTTTTGAGAGWSRFYEHLITAGVGLAFNGIERETYTAADSAGFCYDRALTALAGSIVGDQSDASCAAPPPVAGLDPVPSGMGGPHVSRDSLGRGR